MKIGDLVFVDGYEVGIIMSEPRLSEDCLPGGDAYPNERYHLVSVLLQSGDLENFDEEDVELVGEAR
jgi:hypothetical protein